MILLKILFYFPMILLITFVVFLTRNNAVRWVFPFNGMKYKPNTESEREMSQYMRNKVRLLTYYSKRVMVSHK